MRTTFKRRIVFIGGSRKTRRWVMLTILGGFALSGSARAQSVLTPPPPLFSSTPPAIEALGPGEMQVFPPDSALANVLGEVHPLQWGPIVVRPHVNYQFTVGTGLRYSTNQPPANSIVQTFSPGVLLVLGSHWTLDYTPNFTFYSDHHFQDTIGQSVSLAFGTFYDDWQLGLSQNFSYSNASNVQTGTQTETQSFGTGLSASHALNSKISVDLSLSQNLSFPTAYQSTKEWSTLDWVNYQFWPRLTVGLGAGLGYTVATPDNVFEQVQARIDWRATDKISFGITGGAQSTQFSGSGGTPILNPIYSVSIQYQLFEHTQLFLGANQAINTSYFDNQVTQNTSFNGGVNQRLFQRFMLSVSSAYGMTTYLKAVPGIADQSAIDNFSLTVSLGTTIFKRASISTFYTYSQAISDQPGLAFVSNQIGFNLGYAF
jgi:hypothetical protein